MGIPCIDRLGAEIEDRWRAVDYAPSAFPDLSVRFLGEADLPRQISPDDITSFVLRTRLLPQQADPSVKFGQPPITLFRGPRFYIDALYWLDGTTSIHHHAFSGAFQVLAGSSIETVFSFELERTFDGHFVMGSLRVLSSGLLRQGEVRPILVGPKLIHSVFHLERPSVSIVVRTFADPSGPQLEYGHAGIGLHPFFFDEAAERKLQIVKMLKVAQHTSLERYVGDLIAESDLHTAYRVIRECATQGFVDRLIDRVRDKEAADRFRQSVKDYRREALLIARRAVVTDADLRFFLGVLLNASRRRDVLALSREKRPDSEPAKQVAHWLRGLSNVTIKLQVEGTPWQPSLLGLPVFDDEIEATCAAMLSGQTTGWSDQGAGAMVKLRALPALACLFND
ncbi:MAG TPA: hypothetical protein VHG72_00875 [Polyangia bacterium]|nr:hypothetical protein [Polyangia bacterium]